MTTAVIAGFGCTLRLDAAGILRTRVFSSKFTMRPEPQVAGPLLLLHSSPAGLTPGPDLVCNSDGPAMSGGPRGWTARAHSLIHGPRHRVSTVQSRARPLRCHQSLTGPGPRGWAAHSVAVCQVASHDEPAFGPCSLLSVSEAPRAQAGWASDRTRHEVLTVLSRCLSLPSAHFLLCLPLAARFRVHPPGRRGARPSTSHGTPGTLSTVPCLRSPTGPRPGPGGRPQCHGCRLSWSRCPAGSLARLAPGTVTVRGETSHRIRPAAPCPSESRQVSPTRRHGYERPDRTVAFSKAILTRNRPTRTPRRRS